MSVTVGVKSGASAVDGYVQATGFNHSFSTLVSVAGNGANTTFNTIAVGIRANAGTDTWRDFYRGILLFDAQAVLPAGVTIESARLVLHMTDNISDDFGAAMVLTNAPVAAYTSLVNADYQAMYNNPIEYGVQRRLLADVPDAQAFFFDLNATAIAALQATLVSGNVFETGIRIDFDFDDAGGPTWQSNLGSRVSIASVEAVTESQRPELDITYATDTTVWWPQGGSPPVVPPPPSVPAVPGITIPMGAGADGGGTSGTIDLGPAPTIPPPLLPEPLVPVAFPVSEPTRAPSRAPTQEASPDFPAEPPPPQKGAERVEYAPTVKVVLQSDRKEGRAYETRLTPSGAVRRFYRRYRSGPPSRTGA